MSDTFIQLPYTGTTSGDLLDGEALTVGANAVKRERMQITGASATQIAPVTSSGGLLVTLSTVPGYLVTLSSNPVASQIVSLSSGTVTLSSNPTIVSASSGLVQISGTPTVVSASSGLVQVLQSTGVWAVSGAVTITSGTVTLSSNITVITASSGLVQVLTSGTYLVNATSTSGLLTDISRGVSLAFVNFTATSSGLKIITAASGSNKVKVVSYTIVSNSSQEISFYSSNTAIGASSSAPMVLSSYSGIANAGDRTSWLLETSAAGDFRVHLGNAGIVAGHASYFYEV